MNIKQIATSLRSLLGADDIVALREELRPDYVITKGPVPDDRRIGLWCKDKAAADKAAAYLQGIKQDYTLNFGYRYDKELWSIRFAGNERDAQTIIDRLEQTK